MDRLPPEIRDQIAAAADDNREYSAALAATSRAWQSAVERYTFCHISLESNELESFAATFSTEQRRSFLKILRYNIILPAYSQEDRGRFERETDRTRNDEAFTAAISNLFGILSEWHGCPHTSITLEISEILSPSDPIDWDDDRLIHAIEPHDENRTAFRDLGNRRFRYSYLALLRPRQLPEVLCIDSLYTQVTKRAVAYRAAIDIAAKLPHLQKCVLFMCDEELRYPALRRANRLDLVVALQNTLNGGSMSKLQALFLHMDSVTIWNPAAIPPNLTAANSTDDVLGQAIWKATAHSPHLAVLNLTGVFDEFLFWPDLGLQVVEPFWQNLQHLNVRFHLTKPSGGWYFYHPGEDQDLSPVPIASETEMPPGYSSSEVEEAEALREYSDKDHIFLSDRHRSELKAVPYNTSLVPMMKAFAQACLQIPDLKTASLTTFYPISARGSVYMGLWGVWFMAPGEIPLERDYHLDPAFYEDISPRRLFWGVKNWTPEKQVRTILREVGRVRHGDRLVERFVDSGTYPKFDDDELVEVADG